MKQSGRKKIVTKRQKVELTLGSRYPLGKIGLLVLIGLSCYMSSLAIYAEDTTDSQITYYRFFRVSGYPASAHEFTYHPGQHALGYPVFEEPISRSEIGYFNSVWKVYTYADGRIWAAEHHSQGAIETMVRYFHHSGGVTLKFYENLILHKVLMYDLNHRLRVQEEYRNNSLVWIDVFEVDGSHKQRIHHPNRNQTYFYYWGPR